MSLTAIALFTVAAPAEERPLEVEILSSVEDGGGVGMELHRVTIRGVARNDLGEPVAGAEIFVGSTNQRHPSNFEKLLANTRSSATGKFELRDVQVLVLRHREEDAKPTESQFTVFGVQQDHGFVWRESIGYRPVPRPDNAKAPPFYRGEDITVDLTFELGSRLRGRITDDRGQPLADAKVQVGYVDNVRNPMGHGMYRCRFRGSDALPDTEPSSFNAIELLPARFREARTDANGEYELLFLRRHCDYLAMIDPGIHFTPHRFELVTSPDAKGRGRTVAIGEEGNFDWSFPIPQHVDVRVVFEDNDMPAKDVSLIAEHPRELRRVRRPALTDGDGRATMLMKPGGYVLDAEPTIGQPYLASHVPLDVADGKNQLDVILRRAAQCQILAKDQDGNSRANVHYLVQDQPNAVWKPLHSHPTVADYPGTSREGRLEFTIAPGKYRFARTVDSYETEPTVEGDWVELKPGENPLIVFTVDVEQKDPPKTEYGPIPENVSKIWEKQNSLLLEGVRVSLRRVSAGAGTFSPVELDALTKDLDPRQVPDIEKIVRTVTKVEHLPRSVIVSRGSQRREDRYGNVAEVWPKRPPNYTVMFNGREGINYMGVNDQVDVHLRKSFRMGIHHVRELVSWPGGGRPGAPETTIVIEGKDLVASIGSEGASYVQRIDAETGFVHEVRMQRGDRLQVDLYFAPKRLPNGMLMSQATIQWTTNKDRLQRFEASLIDGVQTLDSLGPTTFSLALPPGTMVVDYRSGDARNAGRGATSILKRPVKDLAAYLQR